MCEVIPKKSIKFLGFSGLGGWILAQCLTNLPWVSAWQQKRTGEAPQDVRISKGALWCCWKPMTSFHIYVGTIPPIQDAIVTIRINYSIFSRESQPKPSFVTIASWGPGGKTEFIWDYDTYDTYVTLYIGRTGPLLLLLIWSFGVSAGIFGLLHRALEKMLNKLFVKSPKKERRLQLDTWNRMLNEDCIGLSSTTKWPNTSHCRFQDAFIELIIGSLW